MRLLYMVYRVHEVSCQQNHGDGGDYDDYVDGDSTSVRTPIAGYETKEQATTHAKSAQKNRTVYPAYTLNPWDPFLKHTDPVPQTYEVGVLPIVFPTSIEAATTELPAAVEVLRDMMLETRDEALAAHLPHPPIVFPLWSTTNSSDGTVEHYFPGEQKKYGTYGKGALCGVNLGDIAFRLPRVVEGKRQCKTCLKKLATPAHQPHKKPKKPDYGFNHDDVERQFEDEGDDDILG